MKRSIAAFLIVMCTASVAGAGKTALENFVKFLDKTATADPFTKPKLACICDEPAFALVAGVVIHLVNPGQVDIRCWLLLFDEDGNANFPHQCLDFRLLR